MFKGFTCDKIRVPSCLVHNSSKSQHDQDVVAALLTPFRSSEGLQPINPKVQLAVERAKESFQRSKHRAIETPFISNKPSDMQHLPNVAYMSTESMFSWIRQLTAAIFYDGLKRYVAEVDWERMIIRSPNWVARKGPFDLASFEEAGKIFRQNQELRDLFDEEQWEPGWSAHPKPYPTEIYNFWLSVGYDDGIGIKHQFYGNFDWYTWFSAPRNEVTAFRKVVRTGMSG